MVLSVEFQDIELLLDYQIGREIANAFELLMWKNFLYVVHFKGMKRGPFEVIISFEGICGLKKCGPGSSNIIIVRCEYEQEK